MTATAVVHLITRSTAVTGHRRRQKTWSAQLHRHAQLVGLAPRTHMHAPDLRLFVSKIKSRYKPVGHGHGGSSPSRTRTLCAWCGAAGCAVTVRSAILC